MKKVSDSDEKLQKVKKSENQAKREIKILKGGNTFWKCPNCRSIAELANDCAGCGR
jgi:uncharacterized protein with PIN domain